MRLVDDGVPSWARAILFWRKVLSVERRGVPRMLIGATGSSR